MNSLKRANERNVQPGAKSSSVVKPAAKSSVKLAARSVSAKKVTAKPPIKYAQKAQVKELPAKKEVAKPATAEEEKVLELPEATTLQNKHSKYDSDNEETEEERQHRKYVEGILNADSATRVECERVSKNAKVEFIKSVDTYFGAIHTRDQLHEYDTKMTAAIDILQKKAAFEIQK